ncbi:MAG: ABC transporter ATP-binding protein [Lachnospiraceae bacterium]|nr:ABC transporter ATP-binding protein [Lachnospiraceae bacterium]
MKSLLVYLRQYKKETILAPLFKLLEASFELLVPLVMAKIIDVGIANEDKSYVIRMCLLMVCLGVIGMICSFTAQFFSAKAAVGVSTKLRHALFSHIQSLSFTELDTLGTSTLITRMTSDVNQVQNGVNMTLRLFLRSPCIVFGAMIMAFTIDVKSALVFAAAIPLLSLVVFGIMAITMPLYKKTQAGLDKVLGITRENLTGVRVIRAFNKEEEERIRFEESNDALTIMQKHVGKISGLMNPITYVIVNGATVLLIWQGAFRVDTGVITQGELIALVNYMSQILVELVKLANLIVTITKALASANRIDHIMNLETSMPDLAVSEPGMDVTAENGSQQKNRQTGKSQTTGETYAVKEKADTEEAVRFEHVSLTYKNAGEESLTDIDFSVKKGETVGIIGGTGSGKSSLVNLIPRFYDATKGRVLINGIEVKDYPIHSLRDKIGVVLQKATLFKGTIRENLLWGNAHAADELLNEALEVSQAKEFVDKKEEGLETKVAQGGKNLSGGQRQRLTIARALVKKPEILILDDSASALDFATDAKLRKAIREMDGDMTVFIVSQRTSSIMHADKIIVLDDGHVAGMGTHEELLKSCMVYREIYQSQFKKAKEA